MIDGLEVGDSSVVVVLTGEEPGGPISQTLRKEETGGSRAREVGRVDVCD